MNPTITFFTLLVLFFGLSYPAEWINNLLGIGLGNSDADVMILLFTTIALWILVVEAFNHIAWRLEHANERT